MGNKLMHASIEQVHDLDKIKSAWLALEKRTTSSFFLRWTWIGPWAELVLRETELYLFRCESEGEVIALCFLTLSGQKRLKNIIPTRQVHLNEYLPEEYDMVMQYNDILTDDAVPDKSEVWRMLFNNLAEWPVSWDEINIRSVTEECHGQILNAASRFKIMPDKEDMTWRVPLNPDYTDFEHLLPVFKRKSRQQLKQSIKAYKQEIGDISWHVAENLDEALSYFSAMEELHTRRWEKVNVEGAFSNKKWVDFNTNVIKEGFAKGEILLIKISCESTVMGYLYGFLYEGIAYMYQTGFVNTAENKLRPGYVSHLCAMIYCAENNISAYDFLPDPPGSYKRFFAESGEPVYHFRLQRFRVKFALENFIRWLRDVVKAKDTADSDR